MSAVDAFGLPYCAAFESDEQLVTFLEQEVAWIGERTGDGICRALLPRPVAADAADRTARWTIATAPWMGNPAGQTHGGVTVTILDNAMGILTRTFQRYGGLTSAVNINVNYALPLPVGEELVITTEIVRSGGKLTFTTASIRLASRPDVVCVSASGVYTRIEPTK